jgi:hypothetical protein
MESAGAKWRRRSSNLIIFLTTNPPRRGMTRTLLLLVAVAVLVACRGGDGDGEPTTEATADPNIITGPAAVREVEVVVLGDAPVQVQARVRGDFPDDCTTIDQVLQSREGFLFTVAVSTSRPATADCALVLGNFDEVITLEVAGLPAGEYTVVVNGISDTFTLASDNVGPTSPPDLANASVSGRVWHDVCALGGGEGGAPADPGPGCIAAADGSFGADGLLGPDEPGLAAIEVSLSGGACPGDGRMTTSTDADGTFRFDNLAAGTYCLAVDALSAVNSTTLIPGNWTFPATDQSQVVVELAAGEALGEANFGWDYQFLPLPEAVATEAAPDTCANEVTFIEDVTIPDGTVVTPGAAFTKTWRLQNSGDCPWGPRYSLVRSGGEAMGGPAASALPDVAVGESIDLTVNLTAPTAPGTYRGEWQLRDPNGRLFGPGGEPFWVEIVVEP